MIHTTAEVLVIAEQISLMLNTQLLFIVTVKRNRLCPETESPVLVTFGTRAVGSGGECEPQQKATEIAISSENTALFYLDPSTITMGSEEEICFIVSLDGVPGMKLVITSVFVIRCFFQQR